jgi:hypothetical protein
MPKFDLVPKNKEFGDAIEVVTLESLEDLLDLVSEHEYPITVVENLTSEYDGEYHLEIEDLREAP